MIPPGPGKPMRPYAVVRVAWDDEAKVWYVEESDIDGLATEADTLEELRRKVPAMIQDLLEGRADRPDEIEIDFVAYAHDRVRTEA
jgi:predicted RNase H-like HicB family nuclease